MKEELSKLKTPEGLEDLGDTAFELKPSPSASTTDSKEISPVIGGSSQSFTSFGASGNSQKHPAEENVHHDIDTDMEMEKMVSKVCEWMRSAIDRKNKFAAFYC